jgi:hypothetical protein
VLSFCARYVPNPKYSKLITSVVHKVLDLYAGELGRSETIDDLFAKLQKQVKSETMFQRQVRRLMMRLC